MVSDSYYIQATFTAKRLLLETHIDHKQLSILILLYNKSHFTIVNLLITVRLTFPVICPSELVTTHWYSLLSVSVVLGMTRVPFVNIWCVSEVIIFSKEFPFLRCQTVLPSFGLAKNEQDRFAGYPI